jgi:chromosome segregation ATPase
MLTKIKELMQLKDNVDSLNRKLEDHSATIQELSSRISDFKRSFESMHGDSEKSVTAMHQEMEALMQFKEQLERELYEFKLTQKEIRDKFHKQMEAEVGWLRGAMEKDIGQFNDLKNKLDSKLQTVDKLDSEVQRLTSIAKSIKAQDFELVRYQKELSHQNQEKLMLLRKIDSLERLVAKMRKGR